MSKRPLIKALLAGGLTTLATAALTVHAANGPRAALTAIDVLHLAPSLSNAVPLAALPPGRGVVVINNMHHPLQLQGLAQVKPG
jgi:hypothetical protein